MKIPELISDHAVACAKDFDECIPSASPCLHSDSFRDLHALLQVPCSTSNPDPCFLSKLGIAARLCNNKWLTSEERETFGGRGGQVSAMPHRTTSTRASTCTIKEIPTLARPAAATTWANFEEQAAVINIVRVLLQRTQDRKASSRPGWAFVQCPCMWCTKQTIACKRRSCSHGHRKQHRQLMAWSLLPVETDFNDRTFLQSKACILCRSCLLQHSIALTPSLACQSCTLSSSVAAFAACTNENT